MNSKCLFKLNFENQLSSTTLKNINLGENFKGILGKMIKYTILNKLNKLFKYDNSIEFSSIVCLFHI